MYSAGATALVAAVSAPAVDLSWRYVPVVLVSCLIMLGWALLINNVGRRRYPAYWWAPDPPLAPPQTIARAKEGDALALERIEEGLHVPGAVEAGEGDAGGGSGESSTVASVDDLRLSRTRTT
jgi:hypothetical protein